MVEHAQKVLVKLEWIVAVLEDQALTEDCVITRCPSVMFWGVSFVVMANAYGLPAAHSAMTAAR